MFGASYSYTPNVLVYRYVKGVTKIEAEVLIEVEIEIVRTGLV